MLMIVCAALGKRAYVIDTVRYVSCPSAWLTRGRHARVWRPAAIGNAVLASLYFSDIWRHQDVHSNQHLLQV